MKKKKKKKKKKEKYFYFISINVKLNYCLFDLTFLSFRFLFQFISYLLL